jgi:glycosyltransferase involved in cell wall biosynthesis
MKPVISICIPTYNRARFLDECLESIVRQFQNPEVMAAVNIFILDNQSSDNTAEVAEKFTNNFCNIQYIRDDQPRKLVPGIIKVASLADGDYIWVFSDDDLQSENALQTILNFIKNKNTDLIICNLLGFRGESPREYKNLLQLDQDFIATNRRELFSLLSTKFYTSIDYYLTLCSNWLIKRSLFQKNYYIFEKFNKPLDLFPLPSLLLYADHEYSAGIIATQIVRNRGDNESWGKKNKIKHFLYYDQIWKDYYRKIIIANKEFLPPDFERQVRIRKILRIKDLSKLILSLSLRKLHLYNLVKRMLRL